ncbi:two-component sensor histidine kinase [[Actinomadura] parvosata subsp. kistnae]|uniref:histidine kinase n=1 Tax=[Actinomadura] parvosata subsp. kistnae TaxID=1909395 RepID=A0A1V0A8L0_9ACTN|nr:histidine kinase [Nonomuraea sp. ATCC 55076]AQZ66502.1 two-component sensor histidine kinase [Nonomuraea sp. ATCC 55076]
MKLRAPWPARAAAGFLRSCAVAAVSMLIPAVWAVSVAWGIRWGAANPWSWLGPLVLTCAGTLALTRPVCRTFRFLVASWTGTVVPAGYRQAGPVTQLSTGYWWNGFSYERTRRDALMDQSRHLRWKDPANWRDLRFCAIVPFTAGLVAAVPPVAAAAAVLALLSPSPAVAVACAVVAVTTAPYAWRPAVPITIRFLRPTPAMALAGRVEELTAQRADTTIAQAAEIRRIERDLHDGAQARLVALGLALATAEKLMETDPDQARALLRDARAGAATSLTELRELVRGISPPVLNERGLADAVRALAMDSPLETVVTADLPRRLDPPIESALYFGIAELLTNAAKHAAATRAHVSITQQDTSVTVDVEDDGRGGAHASSGGGLSGLRRRLAAFDGSLEITSPDGGPTRVRMVLPCASL